jgi:DNA-binding Lrp family transcriptional regulator
MPRTQSTDFLEKVIPKVQAGGARNIVELARALHLPVETTRYKVKGMLKRGLTIHAGVDYNNFGLLNHEVYFMLRPKAQSNEKKFFQSLSEHAYLTSYARRLPDNGYVCSFAPPIGKSLSRLMRGLAEEGLVESPRVESLSWKKEYMIQPTFFQLKRGVWEIDWSKIKKEAASTTAKVAQERKGTQLVEFDELDLLIARSLEQDALIKLSDIASSLKTTLNNVFYHFHKHIIEGKLIEGFIIRWNGTPKQESVFVQFEFDGLSMSEEKSAASSLRSLPFLWSDALSLDSGLYIGEAMIPTAQYLQTLQYLSETLGSSSEKLRVTCLDPKTRNQFPLPAHLFEDGSWKFDPDTVVNLVASKLRK